MGSEMCIRDSIWLNGLLQPYADIARAQDKDKELGALIDKVHDEGASRIHRANFRDHASALRAYQSRPAHQRFNGRVNAVAQHQQPTTTPAPAQPTTTDVAAATASSTGANKFCVYCKRKGHAIADCRKRARRQAANNSQQQQQGGQTNRSDRPSGRSNQSPADPAMQQLFKSWCSFVENKQVDAKAAQDFL